MADDDRIDLAAAATRVGLSVPDLKSLVESGTLSAVDDRVSIASVRGWIERDRNARRKALAAFATAVGDEVFY